LIILVTGKPSKVFKDDSSDESFHEFEYLGGLKGTKLSLIKQTAYDSEQFYLINCSSGAIDTLIGQPVLHKTWETLPVSTTLVLTKKLQIQVGEV